MSAERQLANYLRLILIEVHCENGDVERPASVVEDDDGLRLEKRQIGSEIKRKGFVDQPTSLQEPVRTRSGSQPKHPDSARAARMRRRPVGPNSTGTPT